LFTRFFRYVSFVRLANFCVTQDLGPIEVEGPGSLDRVIPGSLATPLDRSYASRPGLRLA